MASPSASEGFAFLLIDVDGYCVGGVDQRTIVSAHREGYRARELGWAFYGETHSGAGSIYFRDSHAPPLQHSDAGIQYVHHLHGLPISPGADTYPGELVTCSSRLLETIRVLHEVVAAASQQPVVIVHKGGHEGVWASRAIANVSIIDLGTCGCPKVDDIGRGAPEHCVGKHCPHHKATRRRAGKIVHCPQLEVKLLALWIAERGLDTAAASSEPPRRIVRAPRSCVEEQY
jgi:hypothetical protein